LLDGAEKLQKHNGKLLRLIESTERKLSKLAESVAHEASRLSQG
jgi:hypothetical protein